MRCGRWCWVSAPEEARPEGCPRHGSAELSTLKSCKGALLSNYSEAGAQIVCLNGASRSLH